MIIGIILWPLKWAVEAILVAWHWFFTAIGLPPAEGITWVLSIVGLVDRRALALDSALRAADQEPAQDDGNRP